MMQPIVKWQYEKLEGSLGLLEDHLADPDCPCKSAGENCARKHLKRTEDYCQETMIILARDKNSPQKEFDQLLKLAEEAKEYRRAEERLLCGDKNIKQSELCPVSWASGWRKYFETLLVGTCKVKTARVHDPIVESIIRDVSYTPSIPRTMVINAGLEGIIPSEYRDFKVELDLVRSKEWSATDAPQIDNFQKIQKICRLMRNNDREWLLVILLDTQLRLIGLFEASIGGPDQTMVAPLEIARIAIKSGATNLILAHNHPSGNPEPSSADRHVFSNLQQILKPFNLGVLEMAVIGHRKDYSILTSSYQALPSDDQSRSDIYPIRTAAPAPKSWPTQGRLMEPQIKIAGKCAAKGKSCSIKVAAVDKIEASTGSINEISRLITQVSERAEKARQSRAPASPRTWAVGTSTTTKYEFEFRIVDGIKLKVSHDPFSFTPIPGYPKELQPRNRDRAATQLQVKRIAANLDPDSLLTDYHGIDRGAPIIGPDMIVESGNGRTMALILSAKEYPEVFARYRKALAEKAPEYGLTFGKKEQEYEVPVLVRVRLSQVDRRRFVEESNASTIIETSAVETARSDALKLTPEMIHSLQIGDQENIDEALRSSKNAAFVRSFISKLPANEQARLVDAKGVLNQDGIRRMTMALFVATIKGDGGLKLAEKFFESTDLEVRTVFNGILRSLVDLGQAESLSASGARDPGYSIGEDLAKAITVYAGIKKSPGYTVTKYIQQMSMVERELNPFQERILVILAENSRSAKKIGAILKAYANLVNESAPPSQESLMPGMDRPSKSQLFEMALKRAALEDINLLDLADPKWLSKKLEVCNLQPEQISRVMSWRPLRDFLAWGTSAGQVRICDSGMSVDAYQVTIYKLKDSTLIHDLLRLAKRIPGMKQVKSPDSREAVFEVRLPAPEAEKLTWSPQGILRPAPRSQGEQQAMFDEKTGSALIDNIIQEVNQALPEAATVGDNIRYSEG